MRYFSRTIPIPTFPLRGEGAILPTWMAHGFVGVFEALATKDLDFAAVIFTDI
jgi:hypothetical protein